MTSAATYTGNPSTRPIDAVRLELGKEVSIEYLTDDEITYCLSQAGGNVLLGASYGADKIAGIFAYKADQSMESSSLSWSQMAEAMRKKAQDLLTRAKSPTLTPRASSSARRPPKFGIGQHDFRSYPGWP